MRLRGRKGIKEALERQTDLVVLDPKPYKGNWANFFGNRKPIHVELGMGKGRFIAEMSMLHQNVNFIGVDMYDELVRRASEKARTAWAEREGSAPNNLALVRFNIEHIEEMFADGEIERVYLNFSDPWPKARHARRRLTHPQFLKKYIRMLNKKGEIHLKTDSQLLFEFSLNAFADMELTMRNISLNLHAEGIRPGHVLTEYEMKFVDKGKNIHRCEVVIGAEAVKEHKRHLAELSGAPSSFIKLNQV